MKHKRKNHQHTNWRKELSPTVSIKEWSRMLHLSWKRDVVEKRDFKKGKIEQ